MPGQNRHSHSRQRGTDARSRAGLGFTLIEIITVIVILGILAGVIAQRYMNMMGKAHEAVGQQALSAAVVHFNLAYMKYAVNTKGAATQLSELSGADYLNLSGNTVEQGDFRFTYTQSGTNVTVTAQIHTNDGWHAVQDANGAAMSRTIPWP